MGESKCWGYVRVSSYRQVTDGDGLGVQRSRIESWCRYAEVELVAIFEDAGISGATTDRPALREVLRAVLDHGEGAVLVVPRLDRVGRDALHVQEILAVLLAAGIRIVAIGDGIDSASGMGASLLRLLTGLLAQFAEIERATISSRLQDGRRRAREQRRPYAVEPAFGMRVEGEVLVDDEREQVVLARMRHLHAEGRSFRSIAAALDAEGLGPRRAARWSHVTIRTILTGLRSKRKSATSERVARARAHLLGDATL
jgi:DNA invertase Pin-like site-specific DNA recombinase